jgi:glyoxylase-like metal-dependent hydrolase (beta-lactamase superfamily II)/rhodanese-related sulfurtransferase
MNLKQFYDEALSHLSYALESNGKVALVDPARDPGPYLDFARAHDGKIVAVFETHPHADFASSHLEFYKNHDADVYVNPKVNPRYPFHAINHYDEVRIGKIVIRALFTPGHSPDHNAYLVIDDDDGDLAVFTGDALFVGDVGRPDLREGTGNMHVGKKELAEMMFNTINNIFDGLDDQVIVYPAHGPGSLCGKNMGSELESSIGKEKKNNWAFQIKNKNEFVDEFLQGQTYIPKYFPYEVELNRAGAGSFLDFVQNIRIRDSTEKKDFSELLVDVRENSKFKKKHIKGSINIQLLDKASKFETWLGSIIGPDEQFDLIGGNEEECREALERTAKIGYENNASCYKLSKSQESVSSDILNLETFEQHMDQFTILDIRSDSELAEEGKIFESALHIPLHELRETINEIPDMKPVAVHCAGGYRSAIGASMLEASHHPSAVYDLSDCIKQFA